MDMAGTLARKNFRRSSNKAGNRVTRMRQTKLMLCVKAKKFGNVKNVAKTAPVIEFSPEKREVSVSGDVVHVLDACVKAFAELVNDGEAKGDGRDTSNRIEQDDCSIQEINSSISKYQSSSLSSKHESVSRPRRNLSQKKPVETCGLSWKEENDLKRALYASLQRKKIKLGFQEGIDVSSDLNTKLLDDEFCCTKGAQRNDLFCTKEISVSCDGTSTDCQNRNIKCSLSNQVSTNHLFKAQRKFALGMRPTEEGLAKRRKFQKKVDCSLGKDDVIPYTEDFINYLCFRGASYLPEGLRYFENVLNKSYSTGNEAQLNTPSSCTSTDYLPDIQRGTRKLKRKAQKKSISALPCIKEFQNAYEASSSEKAQQKSSLCRPVTRSLVAKAGFSDSLSERDQCYGQQSADSDDNFFHGEQTPSGYSGRESSVLDASDEDSEGMSDVISCFVHEQPIYSADVDDHKNNDKVMLDLQSSSSSSNNQVNNFDEDDISSCQPIGNFLDGCFKQNNFVCGCCREDLGASRSNQTLNNVSQEFGSHLITEVAGSYGEAKTESNLSFNTDSTACLSCADKSFGDIFDQISNNYCSKGRVEGPGGQSNDCFMTGISNSCDDVKGTDASHMFFDHSNIVGSLASNQINNCLMVAPSVFPLVHSPVDYLLSTSSRTISKSPILLTNTQKDLSQIPFQLSSVAKSPPVILFPSFQSLSFLHIGSPSLSSHQSNVHSSTLVSPQWSSVPINSGTLLCLQSPPDAYFLESSRQLRKRAPKISTHIQTSSGNPIFALPKTTRNIDGIDNENKRVKTCSVRVKKRIEVERIKRLKVIRKQQSRRQKFNPKKSPPSNHQTLMTSGPDCLTASTISLRSGKIISTMEVGKVERNESHEVSMFASSSVRNQESSNVKRKSHLKKLKVKAHLTSRQMRKNVYSRRLKKDVGSKKKRCDIELIDRSWRRSDLRKYVEKPEEGKQVRPITRSRTLAALEDELNRAKLEVDVNNNEENVMSSFS